MNNQTNLADMSLREIWSSVKLPLGGVVLAAALVVAKHGADKTYEPLVNIIAQYNGTATAPEPSDP